MKSITQLNVCHLVPIQFWNSGFSEKQLYLRKKCWITTKWPILLPNDIYQWSVNAMWTFACLYCKRVFCSINECCFCLLDKVSGLFPPLFATFCLTWRQTCFRGESSVGFIKGPGKKCSLTLLVAWKIMCSACVYRSGCQPDFLFVILLFSISEAVTFQHSGTKPPAATCIIVCIDCK